MVAGTADIDGTDFDFAVARLNVALIFTDGFESGDTSAWSASVP